MSSRRCSTILQVKTHTPDPLTLLSFSAGLVSASLHFWIFFFCPTVEPSALLTFLDIADVDFKDQRGETPLHVACYRGDIPLVRLLLERGQSASCSV